jgi:hypothetical protein
LSRDTCDIRHTLEDRTVARGKSGRVVVDVDPAMKARMYVVLAEQGLTMRDWFVQRAQAFVERPKESETTGSSDAGPNDRGSV